MNGKKHGKTAAAVEWVTAQTDPVTVVTSSEVQADWWRKMLTGTPHAVLVDTGEDPNRRLHPIVGGCLFFDLFTVDNVVDLDSRRGS